MNRENGMMCFVFPMGMEARPFLQRVEVRRRWKRGHATYREVFFEGTVFMTIRCGVGPEKAAKALRKLDVEPAVVISAGIAGGLAPDVRFGEVILSSETAFSRVPEKILASSSVTLEALAQACRSEGTPFRTARLTTSDRAVFRRDERARLYELSGAHAVDMESHAIALEAERIGAAFASVRVISDDHDAPELLEVRDLKHLLRKPKNLPSNLVKYLGWISFLRDIHRAVGLLHPVLVGFLRGAGRGGHGGRV